MTDTAILELYWKRSPDAIAETDNRYGPFCYHIAFGILSDRMDSEESVNDTWLAAWNSIPPTWPTSLKAYLGKITRRLSVSRLRQRTAAKRGGSQFTLALEELGECVSGSADPALELEHQTLTADLNRFLATLPAEERNLFVGRYWYALSTEELSRTFGKKPSAVKTRLHRTREKLRDFLEKEGYA